MVSQVIEANRQQPQHMFYLRGLFGSAKDFYFTVVLLSVIFILVTCKQCSVKEWQQEFEAHSSYLGDFANSPDVFDSHLGSKLVSRDSFQQHNLDNTCLPSNSFCFPSTLTGFEYNEIDAESEVSDDSAVESEGFSSGMKQMSHLSGRIVLCSLHLQNGDTKTEFSSCISPLFEKKTQMPKSVANIKTVEYTFLNDFYTPPVEIKPSVLDWGHKNLYSPSLAFLTLKNVDADSVLSVFDPYSSNSHFYPCNSTEMLLAPGEVVSICFIFFPTNPGLSSGQLVLQTSFGGFLIQAKGFAVESPYSIKPRSNFSISSSGGWRKNLFLFNPSFEALYLEEVTAWISTSSKSILLKPYIWKSYTDLETHEVNIECKILILINDTRSGQMEIPCIDVITVCSECELDSSVGYTEGINKVDYVNGRQIFFGNSIQPPSGIKAMDIREADELLLSSQPSKRCQWRSSALIRNNLSGVERLSLQGFGGSLSLLLLEGNYPLQQLEFKLNFPTQLKFSSSSQPLMKEGQAKNVEDLPLEALGIEVSGAECGWFTVHNCTGFSPQPGESGMHHIPICVLNFSKRSVFWMRVKKAFLVLVLASPFLGLLNFLLFPHITADASEDVKSTKKPFSVTYALNCLHMSFNWRHSGDVILSSGTQKQMNSDLDTVPETKSTSFEQETLDSRNLRFRNGKAKGRRRRKKKSSILQFEVSSSQSGNSSHMEQSIEIGSPFSKAPILQCDKSICSEPSSRVNFWDNEVYLTRKVGDSSFLASTSRIAPHARAPGAKLNNQKNGGLEKNLSDQEKYTYDIWGDHLFGLSLAYQSKEESSRPPSSAIDNSSQSFFVRCPQTFMKNSVISDMEGNE